MYDPSYCTSPGFPVSVLALIVPGPKSVTWPPDVPNTVLNVPSPEICKPFPTIIPPTLTNVAVVNEAAVV
jgi:hypothetical protein